MSSSSVIYALIAGLLPSLVWLWFWLHEDRIHPEPRSVLTISFFGGFCAVAAAIVAEKYVAELYSDPTTRYILWAAIEEISKFIAVVLIALHLKENDEPIDAMIYCIVVALGFAALENALFIMQPLSHGEIAQAIVTGNMRFIGSTLVHIVSSAAVGFAIGYVFYKNLFTKICAAIIGLVVATSIHAAFNISITTLGSAETLKTFAWIWGAVVILIVLFEEIKTVRPKLW